MRIQHNISALNAYNKLNGNNNKLAKNLEKLSSGYAINRAADNAAGLAISEKMRAQITGLETAQQNSKDGISLVQTAEGALTEVHSMLNRMVALTTQASNGIYEDSERTKIQDELDQLCEEIDRIADATNFNGIKLLDGSMTSKATTTTETKGLDIAPEGVLGDDLGTKTILHKEGTQAAKTKFGVDFGNIAVDGAQNGDTLDVEIGEMKFTFTVDGTKGAVTATGGKTFTQNVTTADLADSNKIATLVSDALKEATAGTVDGNAFQLDVDGTGAKEYKVSVDGNDLTIEAAANGAGVDPNMEVKITFTDNNPPAAGNAATITGTATAGTQTDGAPNTKGFLEADFTGITGVTAGDTGSTIKVKVFGQEVEIANQDYADGTAVANAVAAALGTTLNINDNTGTATIFNVSNDNAGKLTLVDSAATAALAVTKTWSADEKIVSVTTKAPAGDAVDRTNGKSWNVNTTNTVVGADQAPGQWASTVVELKADMISDGSQIKIGEKTYTFKNDAKGNSTVADGTANVVDLTALADASGAVAVGDAAIKFGEVFGASGNTLFTLGGVSDGKITLHENDKNIDATTGKPKVDLSSSEAIKKHLSATVVKTTQPKAGAKALRLQIGDTDDKFNKLDVDVQDCHAKALGIDSEKVMRVDDVDKANVAMEAAKAAIENISAVRSKMGALQNRLDHTVNNLEETTTNLTEAESRIRDTDMAKEMMQYTKNNILIQSSQAMLAQANQVPQGVLQLLQ